MRHTYFVKYSELYKPNAHAPYEKIPKEVIISFYQSVSDIKEVTEAIHDKNPTNHEIQIEAITSL